MSTFYDVEKIDRPSTDFGILYPIFEFCKQNAIYYTSYAKDF